MDSATKLHGQNSDPEVVGYSAGKQKHVHVTYALWVMIDIVYYRMCLPSGPIENTLHCTYQSCDVLN